jgi:ribosomal protein S4
MFFKKKNRFKPLYKKFLHIRENVQNRLKIFEFKKKKWEKLIEIFEKKFRKFSKFKIKDQSRYIVSRYPTKNSSYKKQFGETQKASSKFKLFYGNMLKRTLKNNIKNIKRKQKIISNLLLLLIFETRLDTILYRSKFVQSFRSARQVIVHGKILVNSTKVKSPNYILKPGDIISVERNFHSFVKNSIEQPKIWQLPPKHIVINYKTMEIFFNDIQTTHYSTLFSFHLNLEKLITNYCYF